MKNNTWNIVKKECRRFFGDRTMVITTVLLPGFLLYFIYSMMGDYFMQPKEDETPVTIYVENMSDTLRPLLTATPFHFVTDGVNGKKLKSQLAEKEQDFVYLHFPQNFDSLIAVSPTERTTAAPNVQIYYNSTSDKSESAYTALSTMLNQWEENSYNLFDVNKMTENGEAYDLANTEDVVRGVFSQLIPMLLLIMMFSGCMSIVPTSIAGEKERGTLATLLVTPLKRSELALGKVLSVTFFTLLGGLSTFVGTMLSLPKLLHTDELGMDATIYTTPDYVGLLVLILCTVLVLTSVASLISAQASNVKTASSLMLPMMMVVLFIGLTPMMMQGDNSSTAVFLIPIYNSVQAMTQVLEHEISLLPMCLTVGSNVVCTIICIWLLTKMFNSERVMFSK